MLVGRRRTLIALLCCSGAATAFQAPRPIARGPAARPFSAAPRHATRELEDKLALTGDCIVLWTYAVNQFVLDTFFASVAEETEVRAGRERHDRERRDGLVRAQALHLAREVVREHQEPRVEPAAAGTAAAPAGVHRGAPERGGGSAGGCGARGRGGGGGRRSDK